ncbi:hypothetical protein Patl1_29948 [Pistacia atlantica]|uniref:Uncharacterized protein n=1 Tax=Pistacia atlantica TaxID=434234 RepID=A0ACC1ADV5_9ROSI|nr:hypothetical protein Patl1_29948 [Pistacia atlantica]
MVHDLELVAFRPKNKESDSLFKSKLYTPIMYIRDNIFLLQSSMYHYVLLRLRLV